MNRLRLGPSADHVVDVDQFDIGIHGSELLRRGEPRAEIVFRRDRLAFWRVEVLKVGGRDRARAVAIDDLVDYRDRRFGEDTYRGIDDLELVLAELVEHQVGLVFP